MGLRLLIVALLLPATVLAEAKPSELDRAARLVFEQRYEAAARTLEVAWRQSGNRRETVLRILELQGVTWAQLGQEAKAKAAFQLLISLDPKRELGSRYSAKVLKPFSEAQAWAVDNPPLEVSAEPAAVDPSGKVLQLAVKVKNDALKAVKRVKFAVRPEGQKWAESVVELQGPYASVGTDSDSLEWYAEALGERDMVLALVGSAKATLKEGKLKEKEPPQVAVAPPPPAEKPKPPEKEKPEKPKPVVEDVKPIRETPTSESEQLPEPERPPPAERPSNGSAAVRGIGYTSLALGMVSLVVGTVFGGMWRLNVDTLRDKIDNAQRNSMGDVLRYPGVDGPPQLYDLQMRERIRTQALVANVLWAAGAGLAVLGIILYFAGVESADGSGGALTLRW